MYVMTAPMISTSSHPPLSSLAGRGATDDDYRAFVKELYHTSLAQILSPLRPGMTTPHVIQCPDAHYRRAIFELGPVIADYPEQVYLSGVVQGWCPKYVHCVPDSGQR